MSDSNHKYFTLKTEHLEPYLKFPSGLSLKQAKQNAKAIKKAQSITQSEALKLICWGNGLPDVKDFEQAIPRIIHSTFGKSHDNFGIIQAEDKWVGFWYTEEDLIKSIRVSGITSTIESMTSELVKHLTTLKESPLKQRKFLSAVKKCIEFLGHNFYTTSDNIPLSKVTSIHEIYIDLDDLLFAGGGSGGETLMSYVLASCYDSRGTAKLLMERAIDIKFRNDGQAKFDISNQHDRAELAEYASEYRQFGAMCYNLDKKNKAIVKDLLDNYQGW